MALDGDSEFPQIGLLTILAHCRVNFNLEFGLLKDTDHRLDNLVTTLSIHR